MINCYHCNAENKNDSIYCKECGKPVVKLCSECEHEIDADDKFCSHCGKKQ